MRVLSSRRLLPAALLVILSLVLSVSAFAQTEITMWLSSQPAGVPAWAAEFERKFNEENPDIRLNLEIHPSVSQQREKLILSVAAGVAPDIVYESAKVMGSWFMNEYATPLNQFLDRMPDKDDFIPDILSGVEYDGQVYALPFSVWTIVDLYNMDLLAQAAVELPNTWAELEAAAQKLTEVRGDGSVGVFGFRTGRSPLYAYMDLERGMEQLGTTTIEPTGNVANFRNDEAHRVMEHLRELTRVGLAGAGGSVSIGDVHMGHVAIQHLAPTLDAKGLAERVGDTGLQLQFRAMVGPEPGTQIVHHNAGTLFMVNTTSNPEAAWRVMEAWTRPENMKNYMMAHGGSLPVRISLLNDPDVLAMPYAEQLVATLMERITTYGAKHPLYSEFRMPAGTFLQQAIDDELAIGVALEQAEAVVNQIVRDFGR